MWMYEKLLVGATDEEAADHFREVHGLRIALFLYEMAMDSL
jgi:hypothetical protein